MIRRLREFRENQYYAKARKRLERLDTPGVQAWADSAFWSIQQYRETGTVAEARKATVALLAAMDVLLDRSGG